MRKPLSTSSRNTNDGHGTRERGAWPSPGLYLDGEMLHCVLRMFLLVPGADPEGPVGLLFRGPVVHAFLAGRRLGVRLGRPFHFPPALGWCGWAQPLQPAGRVLTSTFLGCGLWAAIPGAHVEGLSRQRN